MGAVKKNSKVCGLGLHWGEYDDVSKWLMWKSST